jgi:type I restriction enzyme S subunit
MTNKTYDYYGASGVIDKVDDYLFDGTYILIAEDGANLLTRSKPLAFLASGKLTMLTFSSHAGEGTTHSS